MFQRPRDGYSEHPQIDGRDPKVPGGTIVYAIGDLHGRLDLLQEIQQLIIEDHEKNGHGLTATVVYLGDYVDRGFQSRELLDHLVSGTGLPFREVFLLGNHDLWLLRFLDDEDAAEAWLRYGGDATLVSYGVKVNMRLPVEERLKSVRAQLAERFPRSHRDFLEGLEYAFCFGDYFFCHAGVRPDLPLHAQEDNDLIWIREPFLSAETDYGKIIVHGHTVEEVPVVRRNRIGIDTGACFTGNLTCLVLQQSVMRFLSTAPDVEDN